MKPNYKIFFAIPYDSATKNLYVRVSDEIRRMYPIATTVIGTDEVGPSPAYSNIASFKAQNVNLVDQFVEQIRKSDIIIADLTHNNPNVHVELGVALRENKNILRVTGRSLKELAFDIQNLDVYAYRNEDELKNKITDYLDIFFRIKQLSISNQFPQLYYQIQPISLPLQLRIQSGPQIGPKSNLLMKDGALKVEFEIIRANTPDDWFGVFFRSGDNPYQGSHLLYVRQDGKIELAIYHNYYYAQYTVLEILDTKKTISGRQLLIAQFENDYLEVEPGTHKLTTDKLSRQAVGSVLPVAWESDVDVYSLEVVCRDTLES